VGMRPSRMTLPNRPWFWIATSIKRKATTHPAPASDAHCVVGHPAKTITGRAPAATNGTRSAQVEFAQPASTRWTSTQCLSCARWSAHSDWYAH
jgi:hypothetical protein